MPSKHFWKNHSNKDVQAMKYDLQKTIVKIKGTGGRIQMHKLLQKVPEP